MQNQMTIKDFEDILNKNKEFKIEKWKKVSFDREFLRWMRILTKIPFFREYFTNFNYIILKKL